MRFRPAAGSPNLGTSGGAAETIGRRPTSNSDMSIAEVSNVSTPAWRLWTGRVLSALPVLMLLFSASLKLSHAPAFIEKWVTFGYTEGAATPIGIVEIACAVIYAVPKTRMLGAILVTGYLGGAIATHVRIGDVFVIPLVLGILAWAGLFLRDSRLSKLLPIVNDE